MKEFFKKLIAKKQEGINATRAALIAEADAEKRAELGKTLEALSTELEELKAKLAEVDDNNGNGANAGNGEGTPAAGEGRSAIPAGATFNPVATYGQGNSNGANAGEERNDNDPLATMEYRTAFMNYVRTGERAAVLNVERRADDQTELADLGVLIPTTIVNEIIKGVEKVRGQLYSKVKKTNLKGGIKYPLGAFSATFNRVGENGAPTDRQNGGSITGYVEFGYKIGEIRLAQTLLMSVMGVTVFETELAKILVEAYVEAMELEIIKGNPANNEMVGILHDSADGLQRIDASHIIDFTAEEIADWTKWEEKLFAEIPLSMEGANPEFVMAKQTYVANLCTLNDSHGQPIKKAGYDVSDKQHKFNEYVVNRVEKDIFKDFNSCTDGEYFGMFWVGEKAYSINSNMNFAVTRYFDNEKNQWVQKGLVINDGKILDPKYIFLLRKKVTTA